METTIEKKNVGGRPRKESAPRYESGRLRPVKSSPAAIRRVVDAAMQGAADPLLGTPLGWLMLHKALSSRQVSAGVAYAQCRRRYDRALKCPPRTARSPAYEAGIGRAFEEEELGHEEEEVERSICQFLDVQDAISVEPVVRTRIIALLDRVCVELLHPTAWELEDLSTALNRLVRHFKIDA